MAHYGVEADRNTPGRGHENGSVEQAHHRFKRAVEQALLMRGTREFADRASYEGFLREIFDGRNKRRTSLGDDLREMKELPPMRIEDFRRERVRVTRFSTIRAAENTYSVSSRLIGEEVDLRLYAETIEVWHGTMLMATMERQRGRRNVAIDYRHRHVIWSLVRKPGAFARYRYREALFPTLTFRRAYDALVESGDGGGTDSEPVVASRGRVRLQATRASLTTWRTTWPVLSHGNSVDSTFPFGAPTNFRTRSSFFAEEERT